MQKSDAMLALKPSSSSNQFASSSSNQFASSSSNQFASSSSNQFASSSSNQFASSSSNQFASSSSNQFYEQWPPVWKSIEECPHYMYILPYLKGYRKQSTDSNIILLYKQVEETRGFDVNVDIYGDGIRRNPFSPRTAPYSIQKFELWCKAAVEHINKQAQMHGELYEYFEFGKGVSLQLTLYLLTFKVKKLKPEAEIEELKTVQTCMRAQSNFLMDVLEWRFKPQDKEEEGGMEEYK